MAEMDEVEINSTVPELPARRYPGMSPLQAGLTYGGGAAAVMGPIGLLFGVGAGLVAKRMKTSWLDQEASHRQNLRDEHVALMQQLGKERQLADPDEARLLDHATRMAADGWNRMASGDYETGSRMVADANAMSRDIMLADSQARKQQEAEVAGFQRGLIQTAANDYRQQYLKNMEFFEQVDEQAQKVLELVASDGFDPNKPFNKAVLMDLISVGVGGIYKDDPSGLESLVREVPVIGNALGDALKSDDYKISGEEFNRVALELKRRNEQYAQARMTRLGEQAKSLDAHARRIGAIQQDYSLADYVSGGVKELKLVAPPKYTAPRDSGVRAVPSDRFAAPVNKQLRRLEKWMSEKYPRQPRPTN